jgi:hypothetical protein
VTEPIRTGPYHAAVAAKLPSAKLGLSLRSIGDDCARIWLRDIRALTVLAAALELPLVLADIVLHVTPGVPALADGSISWSALVLLVGVYGALSHHFLAGLLERVVGAERHGHPQPTLGEVLHDLPWGRLVVADLLLTAMIVVGFVAFVVPALLVITWFAVVLPIVNMEGRPVLASFARSYRLVRGHSWRVLVLALLAFAVPETIIGFVTSLAHAVTDHVVLNALAHAIPATILLPIAALPIVVLAFDLVALDAAAHDDEGAAV